MSFDTATKSPGVYVLEEQSAAPIAGVGTSTAAFIGVISAPPDTAPDLAKLEEVKFCTNFTEFNKFFGTFSKDAKDEDQNILAHAVLGFFRNGGTRCYVVGVASKTKEEVDKALTQFGAIDEIAIVAAPGMTDDAVRQSLVNHCKDENMQDRVAILDSPKPEDVDLSKGITAVKSIIKPANSDSDYAAVYFPWLLVYDPVSADPKKNPNKAVPPSGHIAGIYARVDNQRGVYKAPANEVVVGAAGLAQPISRGQQGEMNKEGINCIRNFNGNIKVWGARTTNMEKGFRYISTRRLFNYLRESIDEGTQWTVFEPNSPELWARIRRNVTAFLTVVWRSGALFGSTPEEAFYVKCDAENNPPDLRERGEVHVDIGVAVVNPAEFVIFRLSQWSGSGGN